MVQGHIWSCLFLFHFICHKLFFPHLSLVLSHFLSHTLFISAQLSHFVLDNIIDLISYAVLLSLHLLISHKMLSFPVSSLTFSYFLIIYLYWTVFVLSHYLACSFLSHNLILYSCLFSSHFVSFWRVSFSQNFKWVIHLKIAIYIKYIFYK